MNPITIPYHLLLPLVISLGLLTLIVLKKSKICNKKYKKSAWISAVLFFSIYSLIVGAALGNDIYFQQDVNSYDINKDGFFSTDEITKELKEARYRLINDVGRNFSFITGLIFSVFITLPVYLIGLLIEKYRNKKYLTQI